MASAPSLHVYKVVVELAAISNSSTGGFHTSSSRAVNEARAESHFRCLNRSGHFLEIGARDGLAAEGGEQRTVLDLEVCEGPRHGGDRLRVEPRRSRARGGGGGEE